MKLVLKSARLFMQISTGLLILASLWTLGDLFFGDDLERSVETRIHTREALSRLEEQSRHLEQLSLVWAVSESQSLEIRERITGVLSDVRFADPIFFGAYRLQKATLPLPGKPARDSFAMLSAIQGLAVRVQNIDITVDAQGLLQGSIELAWIESL